MPGEFSLRFPAVDILLEHKKAGIAPPPFKLPRAAMTFDERARVRDEIWAELRKAGLASGDQLDGDVDNALEAWARPEVLIVVRASQNEGPEVKFRACAAHGIGVFSSQAKDAIEFSTFKAEYLVGEVTATLPRWHPVPLREAILDKGAPPLEDDDDPLAGPPVTPQGDARAVERFFSSPIERLGTFELSVAPPGGKPRFIDSVQFFDTEAGRFAAFPVRGSGARKLVGTDGSHIRRWLHDEIGYARR